MYSFYDVLKSKMFRYLFIAPLVCAVLILFASYGPIVFVIFVVQLFIPVFIPATIIWFIFSICIATLRQPTKRWCKIVSIVILFCSVASPITIYAYIKYTEASQKEFVFNGPSDKDSVCPTQLINTRGFRVSYDKKYALLEYGNTFLCDPKRFGGNIIWELGTDNTIYLPGLHFGAQFLPISTLNPDGNSIIYIASQKIPREGTDLVLYIYNFKTKTESPIYSDGVQIKAPLNWNNSISDLIISSDSKMLMQTGVNLHAKHDLLKGTSIAVNTPIDGIYSSVTGIRPEYPGFEDLPDDQCSTDRSVCIYEKGYIPVWDSYLFYKTTIKSLTGNHIVYVGTKRIDGFWLPNNHYYAIFRTQGKIKEWF